MPVCTEPLIIESKLGKTEGRTSFNSFVGTTSQEQVVDFIFKIMSDNSEREIA